MAFATLSAFDPGTFTWALGIEDTCVYPADPAATPLDEHELTDHSRFRSNDLALAARLGATALRYGASWPLVHVAPGIFVWDQLDAVVDGALERAFVRLVGFAHGQAQLRLIQRLGARARRKRTLKSHIARRRGLRTSEFERGLVGSQGWNGRDWRAAFHLRAADRG